MIFQIFSFCRLVNFNEKYVFLTYVIKTRVNTIKNCIKINGKHCTFVWKTFHGSKTNFVFDPLCHSLASFFLLAHNDVTFSSNSNLVLSDISNFDYIKYISMVPKTSR